jgi:NADH-quinone oxidoreductase E subunit
MEPSLIKIFEEFPNARREDLIPILQRIQDEFGFLSKQIITRVGEYLDISVNKIYGVATFYDSFQFEPAGKYHIRLCHGTACHVAGALTLISELEKLLKIKSGQTDKQGLFSLEVVSCMGACGLGPIIQVNEDFHTCTDTEMLRQIIDSIRNKDTIIYES